MRYGWFGVGLSVLMASPGCLEVSLQELPGPQCTDFSARSLRALPREALSLSRNSRVAVEARFHPSGELRAVAGDFLASGVTFEAAALELLQNEKTALRLSPHITFQNPIRRTGKAATYVRSEALYRGHKIHQGQSIVALQKDGDDFRVKRLSLRVPSLNLPEYSQSFTPEEAISIAERAAQVELFSDASTVEVVALPTADGGVWAYRVVVSSISPRAELEVLLNAQTRELISTKDLLRYDDGVGLVFDPNPIASTGDTTLRDIGDQNSAALDAARFSVTLLELDGTGVLRGPFADVRNDNSRATDATLTFNFQRADNRFEEVMAYFHIDRTQRYIQETLGFTDVNNRRQIAIANSFGDDNSFYSPSTRFIEFGSGGVDDAEDADIIVHEYGHSIQDDQGMGDGEDLDAMGEGFGDYWAATVGEIFSQEVRGTECVGDWDTIPCLRRVDGVEHFPEGFHGQIHDDGEMWSALLFELRGLLGAEVLDTILLESQFLIGSSASFGEATQALIDADQDLFFGQNSETIRLRGVHRGFLRALTPSVPQGNIIESQPLDISPCDGGCGDDFDDTQIINVPGAEALSVHFSVFSTEVDDSCFGDVCDNVYLYDAAGNLFDILGGELGAFDSKVIPGDTIQVRFVSDFAVASVGYTIDRVDVISICQ